MSGKRKYSKTGIALVLVMVVCLLLVLAVIPGVIGDDGKDKNLDDENTPGLKTVVEEGTPIMIFDKSEPARKLMQAFDDDAIASVEVAYYQDGTLYTSERKAPGDILAVYKALKNVVVAGETDGNKGNEYNRVIFRLDDGTESEFVFKGDHVYVSDGEYYDIVNEEDLWQTVREVADVQP